MAEFRRVVDDLAARSEAGEFVRAGGRLPSYPHLCSHYELGQSTIQKALIVLEYQGLVERRPGRGYWVTEKPAQ